MPVADTSFLVDLMRRDSGALKRYSEYEEQGIALTTTAITAMELYKGHMSPETVKT
jgi:predicted nucleic acid-binding protein